MRDLRGDRYPDEFPGQQARGAVRLICADQSRDERLDRP